MSTESGRFWWGLCKMMVKITKRTGENVLPILHSVDMPGGIGYNSFYIHNGQEAKKGIAI